MRVIELTGRQFDSLPEYSTSIPTGTIVGKRWRRQLFEAVPGSRRLRPSGAWLMGEYTRHLPELTCCRYHRCIAGVMDDHPCLPCQTAEGVRYDPNHPELWAERPNLQIEIAWFEISCPDRVAEKKKELEVHLL